MAAEGEILMLWTCMSASLPRLAILYRMYMAAICMSWSSLRCCVVQDSVLRLTELGWVRVCTLCVVF